VVKCSGKMSKMQSGNDYPHEKMELWTVQRKDVQMLVWKSIQRIFQRRQVAICFECTQRWSGKDKGKEMRTQLVLQKKLYGTTEGIHGLLFQSLVVIH